MRRLLRWRAFRCRRRASLTALRSYATWVSLSTEPWLQITWEAGRLMPSVSLVRAARGCARRPSTCADSARLGNRGGERHFGHVNLYSSPARASFPPPLLPTWSLRLARRSRSSLCTMDRVTTQALAQASRAWAMERTMATKGRAWLQRLGISCCLHSRPCCRRASGGWIIKLQHLLRLCQRLAHCKALRRKCRFHRRRLHTPQRFQSCLTAAMRGVSNPTAVASQIRRGSVALVTRA